MRLRCICFVLMSIAVLSLAAQVTTGSLAGRITGIGNRPLAGAAVKLVDGASGTAYFTSTNKTGFFAIANITPGSAYAIEFSFVNYLPQQQTGVVILLGEETWTEQQLKPDTGLLLQVTVHSSRKRDPAMILHQEKLERLPGNQLYDHLRAIPYAKLQESNEGAISFAGQNNRYNAIYVDGALNNDVFGLSASGTNGGQASVSLLPLEAVSQYQVALAPYDASLGNFTGAAINAATRSGGNKKETAVYHFFSSRDLAGKTPTGDKKDAQKPDRFFTRTYGMRTQGAMMPGRLFYFFNMEWQRDLFSQPFVFEQYKGNTRNKQLIDILTHTIRGTYQYDPGTWLDNPETINADRVVSRIDWNINPKHIFTAGIRYTYAQRMKTNAGNANTIHFSNNGYALFSSTVSASAELKSRLGKTVSNAWLLTYTSVKDDREPLHQPFPRVRINDGEGALVFGTDNSSTINLLVQENWNCIDKLKFTRGAHQFMAGFEIEQNRVFNAFIQNSFGNYTYSSLADFLTNARPSAYQLNFPLTDGQNNDRTNASAQFSVFKTAFFLNDEIRGKHVSLQLGIRYDKTWFPKQPAASDEVNATALPLFGKYWDLQGATSGARIEVPATFSPRVGFVYRFPRRPVVLRGGIGIFTGRIPLVWPGGVYNNNGVAIGGFNANPSQLSKIRFRPDPYRQWTPGIFGVTSNKEPLNLLAASFRMPSLWRTSIAVDRRWTQWSVSVEAMFSRNIQELRYTNIGILPPAANAEGPDNRAIYPSSNNARIPVNPDGSNPFDYSILLGNRDQQTGYAYDLAATVAGPLGNHWKMDLSYHYGQSYVNQEGTASVNLTQWRAMETVQGRNGLGLSVSDFSGAHRVFAMFDRQFRPWKKAAATLSIIYTGQSGSPVSYVYDGSMTRDDGAFGAYDLIYVPTTQDLESAMFLPNTINGTTYSPEMQKAALNRYIENDHYLRSRRGQYAERNGSRLPFTHIIDLRLRLDIWTRLAGHSYKIQLTYDLFNFTNFLSRELGRRYYQPNDNIHLIDFAGYGGPSGLTPQFRFDPGWLLEDKYPVSASSTPTYSARWNGRLGIKLVF